MFESIEKALDRAVRPALAEHEGNIAVESYANGVLKLRLLGRCSGCPSAQFGTEAFIREQLRAALPEVRDIVLVSGVGEETLEMARAILTGRKMG